MFCIHYSVRNGFPGRREHNTSWYIFNCQGHLLSPFIVVYIFCLKQLSGNFYIFNLVSNFAIFFDIQLNMIAWEKSVKDREGERKREKLVQNNGNISHYVPCKNAESCHSH